MLMVQVSDDSELTIKEEERLLATFFVDPSDKTLCLRIWEPELKLIAEIEGTQWTRQRHIEVKVPPLVGRMLCDWISGNYDWSTTEGQREGMAAIYLLQEVEADTSPVRVPGTGARRDSATETPTT